MRNMVKPHLYQKYKNLARRGGVHLGLSYSRGSVGGLCEPRKLTLHQAMSTPLHSSLGDRERPDLRGKKERRHFKRKNRSQFIHTKQSRK